MYSGFIPFKSSRIHYFHSGTGHKLLLCLHGYGESQDSFHFLQKYLPGHYHLLAIDLPFHGKTEWNDGPEFTSADLVAILDAIRAERSIHIPGFTVMGFSMGGRMALGLVEELPGHIEKLVLLAPDGLKVNFWYWLATQTYFGNWLFRFTMKNPQWFFLLLASGHKIGLVNASIYKFIHHYLHDTNLRRLLYDRWTCMRRIKPNLSSIKQIIREKNIPVRLLYGRYDRVILFKRGEKFRKGIESFCTLKVIEAGHQVLAEKHAALIIGLIDS